MFCGSSLLNGLATLTLFGPEMKGLKVDLSWLVGKQVKSGTVNRWLYRFI
jgi:hypothetical protein